MRIMFASAHPYIPQITGGAQASTHEMTRQLRALDQEVSVLAGLTGQGWTGLRGRAALKIKRGGIVRDTRLGYPVYRAWFPEEHVGAAIDRARPDVAVVQSGRPVPLARAFDERGIPVVYYFRNADGTDLGGDPSDVPGAHAIANSEFTARHYAARYGIESTVVLPMMTAARYRTESTRETVTFVNPHPQKGVDIALALAEACPDIPFLFVEAWSLDPADRARLLDAVARLRNVTLHPRTDDMRAVYAHTAILLAPSRWQEAFGRVAAEAQFSGIPVLATRCGGLPEAVGSGGELVDADADIGAWISALRRMWADGDRYAALSRAARERAGRPSLDKAEQALTLLDVFRSAAGRRAPAQHRAGARRAQSRAAPALPQGPSGPWPVTAQARRGRP